MKLGRSGVNPALWRVCAYLGSVRFAVPVMILVALSLAWGTYLEATHDSSRSRAAVYGSWWFIGLMALVCVSLVCSVVTRYPWRRRHVGFITVHAGLVVLIVGGFWSLLGRVEGELTLDEGESGSFVERDIRQIQLVDADGQVVDEARASPGIERISLGGRRYTVERWWQNTAREIEIRNDGTEPFRAIEIALDPNATSGSWVGDESKAERGTDFAGLRVRVLPPETPWTTNTGGGGVPEFVVGTGHFPLVAPGKEVMPGWTLVEVKRFEHAMVAGGELREGDESRSNPAVQVVIRSASGAVERHIAFMEFPDMVMSKVVEGTGASGARLLPGAGASPETLVIYGPLDSIRLGYVGRDGVSKDLASPGTLPANVTVGSHTIRLLRQFDRTNVVARFVGAMNTGNPRPGLLLRDDGTGEELGLAWKATVGASKSGVRLRYAPALAPLPFTVTLKKFTRTDYPGTGMAMAYESEVLVKEDGRADEDFLIHMNVPLVRGPWKVYQSGYLGDQTSVFSVMKDPGLPVIYAGSIILCVGVFITFFVRSIGARHPGITDDQSPACAGAMTADGSPKPKRLSLQVGTGVCASTPDAPRFGPR